jgi:hypothetical protein
MVEVKIALRPTSSNATREKSVNLMKALFVVLLIVGGLLLGFGATAPD